MGGVVIEVPCRSLKLLSYVPEIIMSSSEVVSINLNKLFICN